MSKWTYEIEENSDIWREELLETKEEAIEKGTIEAILNNEFKKKFVYELLFLF